MLLTAKAVSVLQRLPEGKRDIIYFDEQMPGFGLRLRAGAKGAVLRSWVCQFKRGGRSRRMLLGQAAILSAAAAREQARKILGRVANGEDPAADRAERRDRDALTLRSIVGEYLAAKKAKVRSKTLRELTRYLTATPYFGPLFTLPLDALGKKDIAARLVAIERQSGEVTASHARAALNGLFTWALTMGLCESNPLVGVVKPQGSQGRDRVLTDAELVSIWRAAGDGGEYGKIARLLILTACRRQEIGSMRWSELDAGRGVWVIPFERTKNKRPHALPLPSAAWDIVNAMPNLVDRDYLFGVRAEGFADWGDSKAAFDKKLSDMAAWTLHDLRRTAATRMADIGIAPHIIEAALNHFSGHRRGVAGIYNRSSYGNEMRAALALWADHVRALAAGDARKIVSFQPAS
jgi:integrase